MADDVIIFGIVGCGRLCYGGGVNTLAPGVNRGGKCSGIPALPPLIVNSRGERARCCGPKLLAKCNQVVEHLPLVSGLVAIGSQAVSSLRSSESPRELTGGGE